MNISFIDLFLIYSIILFDEYDKIPQVNVSLTISKYNLLFHPTPSTKIHPKSIVQTSS